MYIIIMRVYNTWLPLQHETYFVQSNGNISAWNLLTGDGFISECAPLQPLYFECDYICHVNNRAKTPLSHSSKESCAFYVHQAWPLPEHGKRMSDSMYSTDDQKSKPVLANFDAEVYTIGISTILLILMENIYQPEIVQLSVCQSPLIHPDWAVLFVRAQSRAGKDHNASDQKARNPLPTAVSSHGYAVYSKLPNNITVMMGCGWVLLIEYRGTFIEDICDCNHCCICCYCECSLLVIVS